MSPILVMGNVLPFATVTVIPAGASWRLERRLGSPTTWILAPESNRSFGGGGGAGGCAADTDAV
jgi:hypothetical protein